MHAHRSPTTSPSSSSQMRIGAHTLTKQLAAQNSKSLLLYLSTTSRRRLSTDDSEAAVLLPTVGVSVMKTVRTASQKTYLEKEISILKDLPRHANIVRLLSVVLEPPQAHSLYAELEYCDAGDLRSFSKQSASISSGDWIWDVFTQLLRGLVHLSEFNVLHRNIRPSNCLLSSADGTVKLADFTKSTKLLEETGKAYTRIANEDTGDDRNNTAPEVLIADATRLIGYDGACDVYSLGKLILDLCALSHFPASMTWMRWAEEASIENPVERIELRTLSLQAETALRETKAGGALRRELSLLQSTTSKAAPLGRGLPVSSGNLPSGTTQRASHATTATTTSTTKRSLPTKLASIRPMGLKVEIPSSEEAEGFPPAAKTAPTTTTLRAPLERSSSHSTDVALLGQPHPSPSRRSRMWSMGAIHASGGSSATSSPASATGGPSASFRKLHHQQQEGAATTSRSRRDSLESVSSLSSARSLSNSMLPATRASPPTTSLLGGIASPSGDGSLSTVPEEPFSSPEETRSGADEAGFSLSRARGLPHLRIDTLNHPAKPQQPVAGGGGGKSTTHARGGSNLSETNLRSLAPVLLSPHTAPVFGNRSTKFTYPPPPLQTNATLLTSTMAAPPPLPTPPSASETAARRRPLALASFGLSSPHSTPAVPLGNPALPASASPGSRAFVEVEASNPYASRPEEEDFLLTSTSHVTGSRLVLSRAEREPLAVKDAATGNFQFRLWMNDDDDAEQQQREEEEQTKESALHSREEEEEAAAAEEEEENSLILGNCIGEGSFSKVYRAVDSDNGCLLAVKVMDMDDAEALEKEIRVLTQLESHPNLVEYIGTKRVRHQLWVLLEYCSGGSIAEMLRQFGKFPERLVRVYTIQMVEALMHLHRCGFLHCDVKGANVLVDGHGAAKLSDFGCSVLVSSKRVQNTTMGTLPWMAPEVARGESPSFASDVWSLGATVVEMATGQAPWSEHVFRTIGEARFHIASATSPPSFPTSSQLSSTGKDFLSKCLAVDPRQRWTAKQLGLHEFCSPLAKTRESSTPLEPRTALPVVSRTVGAGTLVPVREDRSEGAATLKSHQQQLPAHVPLGPTHSDSALVLPSEPRSSRGGEPAAPPRFAVRTPATEAPALPVSHWITGSPSLPASRHHPDQQQQQQSSAVRVDEQKGRSAILAAARVLGPLVLSSRPVTPESAARLFTSDVVVRVPLDTRRFVPRTASSSQATTSIRFEGLAALALHASEWMEQRVMRFHFLHVTHTMINSNARTAIWRWEASGSLFDQKVVRFHGSTDASFRRNAEDPDGIKFNRVRVTWEPAQVMEMAKQVALKVSPSKDAPAPEEKAASEPPQA